MYGKNLSALHPLIATRLEEPQVMHLNVEDVIGESACIHSINVGSVPADPEALQSLKQDFDCEIIAHGRLHGLALWFEVEFPHMENQSSIVLGTSPSDPATHWKQTVFFIHEGGVSVNQGDRLKGVVSVSENLQSHRLLDFHFNLNIWQKCPNVGFQCINIEKQFTLS